MVLSLRGTGIAPSLQLNMLSSLPQLTQGRLGLTLDDLLSSTTSPVLQPLNNHQASLLEQLQLLASRNTQQQAQLATASSLPQASLLNQLAGIHTIQASQPLAPSQHLTSSSSIGHLVPKPVGQNVLMASSLSNQHELLQSLIRENALKEKFIALLLTSQQTGVSVPNSHVQLQSQVGQLEKFLPNILSPSNSGQSPIASVVANSALLQPQMGTHQLRLHANPGSMPEARPLLAQSSQATTLALPSNSQLSSPKSDTVSKPVAVAVAKKKRQSRKESSDVKERWMMRFSELKKFRQVRKDMTNDKYMTLLLPGDLTCCTYLIISLTQMNIVDEQKIKRNTVITGKSLCLMH